MALTGPNSFALISCFGISVLDTAGMPEIPVAAFKVILSPFNSVQDERFRAA
jgi:hypothetical protein